VTDEATLAVAEQHVIKAETIVARQLQVIGRLRSQGLETTEAEQMLALYEEILQVFRRHRDSILKELGREA
jgi:hypothetical protein